MHRPGIAKVVSNKIVLDGTTIEEVKYHRDTLILAVLIVVLVHILRHPYHRPPSSIGQTDAYLSPLVPFIKIC